MKVLLLKYARLQVVMPLLFAIFGLVFLSIASTYPYKSGVFPKFILYILLAASIWQLIIEVLKARKTEVIIAEESETEKKERKSSAIKFWSTVISLIIYVFLIFQIGFYASTIIFVTALTRMLGLRSWIWSLVVAIGTVAFLYFIFVYIFSIPLPMGKLFGP